MKRTFWILAVVAAASIALAAACDQTDAPAGSPPGKKASIESAQATRVTTPSAEKPKANDAPVLPADDAVRTCRAAIQKGQADPANLNDLLRSGCASMIQNETCRGALDGTHEGFWTTCVETYCPVFEKEKRTSVMCEQDAAPVARASDLALRAAFLTDVMLLERDLEELDGSFHAALRSALEAPAGERETKMKMLFGRVLKSNDLTADQKQFWSIGTVMAIMPPVAPSMVPRGEATGTDTREQSGDAPSDPHHGHNH